MHRSTETTPAPYLSVVATSRNDNHGGDLTRRMQLFLDGLGTQANRHEVPVELIMVEWNPPADRQGLREELRWPDRTACFEVRIVVVPTERHVQLDPKGALPIFQMIAKNVGIRRARGAFVLATNVDILFPDDLFRWLKQGLRHGVLYRNDRLDVSREIPDAASFDDLLQFCRAHVIRRHEARGTLVPDGRRWVNTSPSALDACRQQLRFWRAELAVAAEQQGLKLAAGMTAPFGGADARPSGVPNPVASVLERRPRLRRVLRALLALTLGPPLVVVHSLFVVGPVATGRLLIERARHLVRVFRVNRTFVRLHTNGCGDFTLLDRDTWFRLRGYPEWPVFSWALDSVFLFQADANRVPNVQLPPDHCTYHIDHGGGWTPEAQAQLFARLAEKGVPVLSEKDFFRLWDEMQGKRRHREPLTYNGDDWGFGGLELPEQRC